MLHYLYMQETHMSHEEQRSPKLDNEPKSEYSWTKPDEVFDWVERIVKDAEKTKDGRRAAKLRWEAGGIITRHAPGAKEADEALVVKENGEIVAAAVLAPGYLVGVYVLPEQQKKGYGAQLIWQSVERLFGRGHERVHMEVVDERSMRLVERLPKEMQSRLDVVDMRRDE